jgi:hypothetical protein
MEAFRDPQSKIHGRFHAQTQEFGRGMTSLNSGFDGKRVSVVQCGASMVLLVVRRGVSKTWLLLILK